MVCKLLPGLILFLLALLVHRVGAQPSFVEPTLATLGTGYSLGSAGAPVVMVEFSDFQCSYCKKFWGETLPKLRQAYINQGKVRFFYRHFAILGNHSVQAAGGAECAGEQGKFWEYHDLLFANQGSPFTAAKLKQYAQELNMNVEAFGTCLNSGKFMKKIEEETRTAAALGARGTPAFFLNGKLLVGAQPFEIFKAAIEEELRRKPSKR